MGILTSYKVTLKKHYIWDILEITWKKVKGVFNGNAINLLKSVTISYEIN